MKCETSESILTEHYINRISLVATRVMCVCGWEGGGEDKAVYVPLYATKALVRMKV